MTDSAAVGVLLVTPDAKFLLVEPDFSAPSVELPAGVNPDVELLAALGSRFGIRGRVVSLVEHATYVVRMVHNADETALGLQRVAESELLPAGGIPALLALPDLREEGVGLAPLTAVAVRAASRAARAVHETVAGGSLEVSQKLGVEDLVTTADRAAEGAAIAEIRRHRPDDAILAEESGEHGGSTGVQWIIDPIDGTGNFVLGRADHAVSIAAYRGDEPVAAVIYRPADRAWAATGENGPTGNLPLACRTTSSLREAVVSIGVPHDPAQRIAALRLLEHLFPHVRDFRRIGSACCDQLSVATGTLDAYIGIGLGRWDYAAGFGLVPAAGGAAETVDLGAGLAATVVAAPGIAAELMALLRSVPTERSLT